MNLDLTLFPTHHIQKIHDALSGELRLIGGCVRDVLFGHAPKDIDLATPCVPEEVIEKLGAVGIKVKPTGIDFGTVTAILDKTPYEITTLRSDIDCDGRRAKVRFSTDWEEDSHRRDFTVNALSADLDGVIYDYHNGLADLKTRQIRFIGDAVARCREDYLRILRFFRFQAYYGNQDHPDEEALRAISVCKEGLATLSAERIGMEMRRLLIAEDPAPSLATMQALGVDKEIGLALSQDLASFNMLYSCEQDYRYPPSFVVRLALLLLLSPKSWQAHLTSLDHYWRMSKAEVAMVTALIQAIEQKPDLKDTARMQRHIRSMGKIQAAFFALIASSYMPHFPTQDYMHHIKHWDIPKFPLKGGDLIEQGIQPGKNLGTWLKKAECWWEAQHYQLGREELLHYIEKERRNEAPS